MHAEYAFDMYMGTEITGRISYARSPVNFKTMEPLPSSSNKKHARYYSGLGFGVNVYLRNHIDADFTMSIVQAHIDNHDYHSMIESYVTLRSQGSNWPWHFGLVTCVISISQSDTPN